MTGPNVDIDRERNRLHNLQTRIEPLIERLWEGEGVIPLTEEEQVKLAKMEKKEQQMLGKLWR